MSQIAMPNLTASIRETQRAIAEASERTNRANQEKNEREIKQVEEIESTRIHIQEFKEVVQEFINATTQQSEIAKESNEIMKKWTKAIGLMTVAMLTFAGMTLIFTILTYLKMQ